MTDTTSQPKTPPDIGSVLRQARTSRGQSLDAIFQHTRIPKKFLEAMESNRFEIFPASVYLQGFLKTYCDHLEIDFESLWGRIQPPKLQADSAAKPSPATAPQSASVVPVAHEKAKPSSDANTLLLVLAVAVVLGVVWMTRTFSRRPAAPPAPAPVRVPASIAPLHLSEAMNLKIIFRREGWMSLHADGRLRFEGRAPAGYSQEWTAVDSFTLRTLKPEDIDLMLDGRPFHLDPAGATSSGDYKITRPKEKK